MLVWIEKIDREANEIIIDFPHWITCHELAKCFDVIPPWDTRRSMLRLINPPWKSLKGVSNFLTKWYDMPLWIFENTKWKLVDRNDLTQLLILAEVHFE